METHYRPKETDKERPLVDASNLQRSNARPSVIQQQQQQQQQPSTASANATPTRAQASSSKLINVTPKTPIGLGLLPDENRDYSFSPNSMRGQRRRSDSEEKIEGKDVHSIFEQSPNAGRRLSLRPISTHMESPLPSPARPDMRFGIDLTKGSSPTLRSTSPTLAHYHLTPPLSGPRTSISSVDSGASPTSISFPMSRPSSGGSVTDQSPSKLDAHSRVVSLTSACAPVTADKTPSPSIFRTGWHGHKDPYGDFERDVARSPILKANARLNKRENLFARLLALPPALLSFIIHPLTLNPSAPSASSPTSPPGSSADASRSTGRRYIALLRVVVYTYFAFSIINFAATILGMGASVQRPNLSPASQSPDLGAWARKVRDGVGWSMSAPNVSSDTVAEEQNLPLLSSKDSAIEADVIRRFGSLAALSQDPVTNPLSDLPHTYRFAKMHEALHWQQHDEIEPFAYRASVRPETEEVTACLYTNEAWLPLLPDFVETWNGPVAIVLEASHSRTSPLRKTLLNKIDDMRIQRPAIARRVDVHLIGQPPVASEATLNRTRHRLLTRPTALNWHVNVMRFFAETDVLFLAGDARLIPSPNLRASLSSDQVRAAVIDKGDVVVVPSFAFVRDVSDPKQDMPSPQALRAKLRRPGPASGIGAEDFDVLADAYVKAMQTSTPLERVQWPSDKDSLVNIAQQPDESTPGQFVMWDTRWAPNHGPSNWYVWQRQAGDSQLDEAPEDGGAAGLAPDGTTGGGDKLYRIVDYDLHFAPHVVISRRGQPWCTERFEAMPAACTYQMYLTGAEFYALPDAWLYTLEAIEKPADPVKEDPIVRLKNSISARLYGKFHQEACMHYGRELLSVQMWNSDKAQHLRSVCAKSLWSWGMGTA